MSKETDLLEKAYFSLVNTGSVNGSLLDNMADIICDIFDESDKTKVYYFSAPIWDYLSNGWKEPTVARINLNNEEEDVRKQFENDNRNNWIRIEDKDENKNTLKYDGTKYISFFKEARKVFSFIEFFTRRVKTINPIYTIEFSANNKDIEYESGQSKLLCSKENLQDKSEFIKKTKVLLKEDYALTENAEKELDAFRFFLIKYNESFKDLKYIYLITSRLYKQNDGVYIGSGGVVLVCKEALDDIILHRISILANLCFRELGGKNWAERCIKESIKSAKAAIMSRNLSHNLGSHVMYFIRQQLSSPKQIVEGGLVLGDYSSNTIFQKYDEYNGIKQPQLPFLVGLSRFLGYLQERQDYIATMATDYIPAPTTINLKDAVYDELKPDLHYNRHKNADTLSKPQNLLLDYIAFSEGYTSSDQIIIQFDDFDGVRGNGLDHLRKINIDIPGGIMGRQALFSIFENIIRNAAKHCYPRSRYGQRILSLKLNLLGDNDSLINEEVYKNNAKDLYYLSIICNMPNQKGEANNLSKKLGERYINDDGTPNENYKGLKEIRLSAAWLRKYKLDTDIPSTLPPAVKVRATELTPLPGETTNESDFGNQEAIEYIIALPKPKKIAFIHYNKDASDSKSHKGEGNNEGYIYIIVNNTDELSLKKIVIDNRLSRYDLIVTDNSSIVNNISKYVPCRLYTVKSLENNPLTSKIDGATASSYYKEWLRSRFPTIPCLTILDNQAKEFYGERGDNTIIIRDNANAPADCYDGTCVFSTHYAGRNNENNYSKYLEKALFVESITGSNSTDRLLRHTPYSDIWLYKHIAASLTKVAIVDERIFSTMYGKHNESQQEEDSHKRNEIKTWVEKYNKDYQEWNTDFYNNFICLNIKNIEESLLISEKVSNIVREDNTEEEKINQIYHLIYGTEATTKEQDFSIIEQYQDKGICFFDIEIKKNEGNKLESIEIVGYNRPVKESLGRLEKHTVDTIARIDKDNGKINDIIAGFKEKFDFICIHQGILDKIYEAYSITTDEEKTAITDEFRSFFGRKKLGNVVIHSGRSIPSSKVMPQQIPFIPLSALDYAVRDCKYTLSELLYTVYSEERQ